MEGTADHQPGHRGRGERPAGVIHLHDILRAKIV